ncbi:MAG: TlpA family protein disulfide reductase [Phycisphaerales bacterium]|nr:MAG: TlpA family protein disulfide reductase [Phycisphaerales bacterium]
MNPQLCKGQAAPLFDVRTLDGKRIRLQDLRGKIVLLTFWASRCGECIADIPMLKELYKAFGNDKRFVMIGLSLDRSAQTLRSFTKSQEMNWTQGLLGDWSQSKIPFLYAVSYIPTTYLIDQNGIMIDVLRGPKTRDAIEKALADLE